MVFGFLSIYFSFGNIENAKILQIVTTILRFLVTLLMCAGAIYYMGTDGPSVAPVFDWDKQMQALAQVFGNTTFVFIYHHSVSGIIYPVRPQKHVRKMFLISNIVGSLFLCTEALLAYFAFSGLKNLCSNDDDPSFKPTFPCKVNSLYNENFLGLPGIGQICNFYPMLNVAAVPILNITLRNNLLDALPIKRWIKNSGRCLWLLEDHRNLIKGVWSIILSIPVFAVVLTYREVQNMVTISGGICGSFILLIIPATVVYYARRLDLETKLNEKNPNKSPFSSFWIIVIYVWAITTLTAVTIKLAQGGVGE